MFSGSSSGEKDAEENQADGAAPASHVPEKPEVAEPVVDGEGATATQ